jgi:hypothetical protein
MELGMIGWGPTWCGVFCAPATSALFPTSIRNLRRHSSKGGGREGMLCARCRNMDNENHYQIVREIRRPRWA